MCVQLWLAKYLLTKAGVSIAGLPDDTATPHRIIIAGAPASGKGATRWCRDPHSSGRGGLVGVLTDWSCLTGTQCELIVAKYNCVHISTGDMLRAAAKSGSELGVQAAELMAAGQLVPDDLIIGIVKDRLAEPDCAARGWLLDGFPRTEAQALALVQMGIAPDAFVSLNVPDELLVERVVGRRTDPETGKIYHLKFNPPPEDDAELLARLVHRADDTEETCQKRLEQFHAHINAVRGQYGAQLLEVDGSLAKHDVFAQIVAKLG